MNSIEKIERWGDEHQHKWFTVLRLMLGLIIFFKGIYFIKHTEEISAMMANSSVSLYGFFIANYVALAHLVGGLLITIGLITRLAILFQLPVLIGAIIFVNAQRGFFTIHFDLELSILVLFLLLFFFVYGSGDLSLDAWMRRHKNT